MRSKSMRRKARLHRGNSLFIFLICALLMISAATTILFAQAGITVAVQTTILGDSVIVDGTKYLSPVSFTWVAGSVHTIGVDSIQNKSEGVRHTFQSWSDGGIAIHSVSVSFNTTFTATFAIQYYLTMLGAGDYDHVSPYSGWFLKDAVVAISAYSTFGYFSHWDGLGSGSYTGVANPASVTMNGPITETATFAACTYTTNPTSGTINSWGGTRTFFVNSQNGCHWTIHPYYPPPSWIHFAEVGSNSVTYSADPNATSSPRQGTIIIALLGPTGKYVPVATYTAYQKADTQITINTLAGWNLVSVPLEQPDYDANIIFPSKFGSMFRYNTSSHAYEEAPILSLGEGYWIYYITATSCVITGDAPDPIPVNCKLAWNLFGSCESPTLVSSLMVEGSGYIFGDAFRYNPGSGTIMPTLIINPGDGVWIYVTGDCTVTIP